MVGAPIEKFWKAVEQMGPGLFIIGLDYHVGFILQTKDQIRFIHSSVTSGDVANEDAKKAEMISASRYRVIGKIISDKNIEDWLMGRRIKVKGRW